MLCKQPYNTIAPFSGRGIVYFSGVFGLFLLLFCSPFRFTRLRHNYRNTCTINAYIVAHTSCNTSPDHRTHDHRESEMIHFHLDASTMQRVRNMPIMPFCLYCMQLWAFYSTPRVRNETKVFCPKLGPHEMPVCVCQSKCEEIMLFCLALETFY